jgi:hypothetical protein
MLFTFLNPAASASGIIFPDSIEGLQVRANTNATILSWPSDPRETFVVLWHPNLNHATAWIVLTNQLRAAKGTNFTAFTDALTTDRIQKMSGNIPASSLYRVLVIPDFWFESSTETMAGGPKNPDEDFIPFYYGTTNSDIFQPQIEMFVDGQDDPEDSGDKTVQLINFGSLEHPKWCSSSGFWLNHSALSNGLHKIQLRTTLTLNNLVGDNGQYLVVYSKTAEILTAKSAPNGKQSPSSGELRGAQLLTKQRSVPRPSTWWDCKLGHSFVRQIPSAEEQTRNRIHGVGDAANAGVPYRPLTEQESTARW